MGSVQGRVRLDIRLFFSWTPKSENYITLKYSTYHWLKSVWPKKIHFKLEHIARFRYVVSVTVCYTLGNIWEQSRTVENSGNFHLLYVISCDLQVWVIKIRCWESNFVLIVTKYFIADKIRTGKEGEEKAERKGTWM